MKIIFKYKATINKSPFKNFKVSLFNARPKEEAEDLAPIEAKSPQAPPSMQGRGLAAKSGTGAGNGTMPRSIKNEFIFICFANSTLAFQLLKQRLC
jgi:hypothetical protein